MKRLKDLALPLFTNFKEGLAKSLGYFFGIYLLIAIACFAGKYIPLTHYFSVSVPKTAADIRALHQLQMNGVIMSPVDLLNNLASFYSIVITILAVFIGFSGIVAYNYIKNIADDKAEALVEKKVANYLEKAEVRDKIVDSLQQSSDQQKEDEDITLDRLQGRVAALEEKLEGFNLQKQTVQESGGANGNN